MALLHIEANVVFLKHSIAATRWLSYLLSSIKNLNVISIVKGEKAKRQFNLFDVLRLTFFDADLSLVVFRLTFHL